MKIQNKFSIFLFCFVFSCIASAKETHLHNDEEIISTDEQFCSIGLNESFYRLDEVVKEIVCARNYERFEKKYKQAFYTFIAEYTNSIAIEPLENLEKGEDEISCFVLRHQDRIDNFIRHYKMMLSVRSESGLEIAEKLKEEEEIVISWLLNEPLEF